MTALSVALIKHDQRPGDGLDRLARELEQRAHRVEVISRRPLRLPERMLAARGFSGPLTHIPAVLARLKEGPYDVAHAFTPVDAAAALRSRLPVVFTCTEPVTRETVADRRLRLRMLGDAVERSDAVLAAGEEVRASLERWFAIEAEVLDAAGHEQLYLRLAGNRRGP